MAIRELRLAEKKPEEVATKNPPKWGIIK